MKGSVQVTVDLVACAITSGFPESRVIFACVALCEDFRPAVLNHFPQLNVQHKVLHVCM